MEKYRDILAETTKRIDTDIFYNSKVATDAIHSGHKPFDHPGTGHPVIPPITMSSTFAQSEPSHPLKYDYTRAGNYSREILEQTVAALEEAQFCSSFSSGLATLAAITNLLQPGDHVIFFNDVYGGTGRYFTKVAGRFQISCEPLDLRDIELMKRSLKPSTRMVWVETPSNPLMRIVNIAAISEAVHAYNKDIWVVVDNTFLTPVFQKPLNLGADMVMHSLTKYMNGHSDVLMGAVATRSQAISDLLHQQQLMVGAVPSPFDCYLALRGLRTLSVRMRQHQFSGLAVALFLAGHPKIERVLHPAFCPDAEAVKNQMTGYGGMLSVYIRGSKEQACAFMSSLKYFYLAESLGGFESLVEIPSLMTHASVPEERRKELGITDNMVRISVGLEDVVTLLDDIDQSLAKI